MGEPVTLPSIWEFASTFGNCHFLVMQGPTENDR